MIIFTKVGSWPYLIFLFVIDRWFPRWPPCTLYRSRSSTSEKRSHTAFARSPHDCRNPVRSRRTNSSLDLCLACDKSFLWSPLRPGFCSFCNNLANQSGRPVLSTGVSFECAGLISWVWGRRHWGYVVLWSAQLVWLFRKSAWVCLRSFLAGRQSK